MDGTDLRSLIWHDFFFLVILSSCFNQIISPFFPFLFCLRPSSFFFFEVGRQENKFLKMTNRRAHAFRVQITELSGIKSLNIYLNPNIDRKVSAGFPGSTLTSWMQLLYSLFFFLKKSQALKIVTIRKRQYNRSILNNCLTREQSPRRGLVEIAQAFFSCLHFNFTQRKMKSL